MANRSVAVCRCKEAIDGEHECPAIEFRAREYRRKRYHGPAVRGVTPDDIAREAKETFKHLSE